MNILHMNDPSWVASKLSKWQRHAGHASDVLSSHSMPEIGMPDFYRQAFPPTFTHEINALAVAMSKRYDVVHVHSAPALVLMLRMRRPRKRIVLHWHGTEVRCRPRLQQAAELAASNVLVSTPDLRRYSPRSIYLPNPIDTSHFAPRPLRSGRGVSMLVRGAREAQLRERLAHIDLDWDAVDTASSPVRYADLPGLLSRYGTYIDVKWMVEHGAWADFRSQVGLEALSLGMRILDHDLAFRAGLPAEHRPENVVKRLSEIYERGS